MGYLFINEASSKINSILSISVQIISSIFYMSMCRIILISHRKIVYDTINI